MSLSLLWNLLMPIVALLAIGYGLAKWAGLSPGSLNPLLRYLLFPMVLFSSLEAQMPFKTFLLVTLSGAAMAVLGSILVRNAHRFLALKIDQSAVLPNVPCFTIPFLAFCLGGRGIATACAFYVGALVARKFIESRRILSQFLREPWFYAVVAAILFKMTNLSFGSVERVANLLRTSAYPILLIYLGAYLHPLGGLKDVNAWATAGARLVCGLALGVLAVVVFRLPPAIAEGVIWSSLAPPATRELSLADTGQNSPSSESAAAVGTLASLLLISLFLMTGWKPWNL